MIYIYNFVIAILCKYLGMHALVVQHEPPQPDNQIKVTVLANHSTWFLGFGKTHISNLASLAECGVLCGTTLACNDN